MSELAVQPPLDAATVHRSMLDRTTEVDSAVLASYTEFLASRFSSGVALLAVGGFGRGELFPCSDVDLLLLVESEKTVVPREAVSGFLQRLWDTNLRPSHSVHPLADCVAEHGDNAEFTISLLDHRFLAGDESVYKNLEQRFAQFRARRGASIARQLVKLAGDRRAKYQNTIYHLEPNIKEMPGGMRDLQTARWLHALDPHGNPPELSGALDFLAGVRWRLHQMAGRDKNDLTFEIQDSLSEHPDALMRDYFRHARVVERAARHAMEASAERSGELLRRFHEWRSRLSTTDFTVSRDRVLLRGHKPPSSLQLFEFVARHGLRLAPDTIDRLDGFVPDATWDDWKRLLNLPNPAPGLRAMQESGVLAAALPEWRNIECLVTRDYYHRYTVDEHTLVAVEALENVIDGRFAALMSGIEDPALIRFSLLLHDIGKGSGRDHSVVSLEIADAVLERLAAPAEDREAIQYLVRYHLTLSEVMTSRDLSDPATARALADCIGTVERLKLLTMLTYADISAVNPQAMSPWRLEQLWQTYAVTHEEFTRELAAERIHAPTGVTPDRAQFLEGLPTRYLRTHTPLEIDAHYALARQLSSRPVALEIEHVRGFYRLTLLTRDRPALFTSVAGAISSFGLDIVKAEAFSNAAGVVLDTFTFGDPHRTLELNPSEVDRLRGVVRNVVEGKQDAEALLRGRPRPLLSTRAKVPPRVVFREDATEVATLIEIVAEDRPGLLHDLAAAISRTGCNIEVVMINTEAHRALDVFYVTHQGGKLELPMQAALKSELLAACIGQR
ncbi:MAG: HD domain-containing protein [Acidobacteriota bacterium]